MNSENLNNSSNASEEISLKDLLLKIGEWYRYVLSKWPIIVAFGLLGGLIGYYYAHSKKTTYIATTTFVLEDGDKGGGGMGGLAGLASMAGVDLGAGGGGIFQGDNILELYRSRKMIEQTLITEVEVNGKKELLVDFFIKINHLRESWDKNPKLNRIHFKEDDGRLRDSVLGTIVADISKNYLSVVKPDKKLSIIRAEVRAKDEFFAKTFNEQIVKNVNDFYIQTKTKKSLQNVAILQQKTDSVRSVMNGAIYNVAAVMDATPNLNPTRQLQRAAPMQRSQFSAETNKAMLSALVQNLEMSKMALRKETPLIQVIDEPIFPLEKQKLGNLKGLIIGGVLFGCLSVMGLLIKKMFLEIFK